MKKIALRGKNGKGKYVIVDDIDYEWLNNYKWHYCRDGYAYLSLYDKRTKLSKHVSLHRFILNAPKEKEVDHINRNKLDNRRLNLRIVTSQQNNWNLNLPKHNTSGYMGVSIFVGNKINKKWRARIKKNGKEISLGYFYTKEDAYKAYMKAKLKYHAL